MKLRRVMSGLSILAAHDPDEKAAIYVLEEDIVVMGPASLMPKSVGSADCARLAALGFDYHPRVDSWIATIDSELQAKRPRAQVPCP